MSHRACPSFDPRVAKSMNGHKIALDAHSWRKLRADYPGDRWVVSLWLTLLVCHGY